MVLLLIVPLFAAACGSSHHAATTTVSVARQTVSGPGFTFDAPASWRVGQGDRSVTAQSAASPPAIVSATVYRIGKAYAPSDFAAAAKELDGVAAKLAAAAGGAITERETATVAGRKIRAYRFTATRKGAAYHDRVGFVLSGKREVQLLCEAPAGAGDPDGACALLFSSFRLSG